MADLFLGVFEHEDDVMAATNQCREAELNFQDVYTPYPVHGLERAMGLKRSIITWVCFGAGATGLTIATIGQWYISTVDWPLNIGGKDAFPFPAFVPVMFELTVLIAGLTILVTMFLLGRLYPGKMIEPIHPRVTDDVFVIALLMDDDFNEGKAREIFEKCGAIEVNVRADKEESK